MTMNTGSPQAPLIQMSYYLKGDHARIESKAGDRPEMANTMIMDLQAGKMTTLMPSQKSYITTDFKQMREAAGQSGSLTFPKLTATGKKETVAGYQCEHYLVGDDEEIDMCVAKGLGYFGMGGAGRTGGFGSFLFSPEMKAEAAANPEWSRLLEGGAFPLKVTNAKGGQTTMSSEVTSVERKKLDDSLFTVPPDYKEMKMPAGFPMPSVSVPGKGGQ